MEGNRCGGKILVLMFSLIVFFCIGLRCHLGYSVLWTYIYYIEYICVLCMIYMYYMYIVLLINIVPLRNLVNFCCVVIAIITIC